MDKKKVMETWKKIAATTVVSGVLLGGAVYFYQLYKTQVELESLPMVKIHKLDLTGLTLRIDVQLKNPTRTAFKIKFPFIKLVYKDATVGSSQLLDKDISIPAFGEAVINEIMIRIPLLSIFSLSGGLIKALQNKEAIQLDVKTISTIDIGWKKVAYSKSNTITLKK
jgi:hypothetical protein